MASKKDWDMYNRGVSPEMDSILQALADERFQFVGEPGPLSLEEQQRIMQSGDASQTQGANPLLLQLLGAYQSGGLPGVGGKAITESLLPTSGAHENIDELMHENSLMTSLWEMIQSNNGSTKLRETDNEWVRGPKGQLRPYIDQEFFTKPGPHSAFPKDYQTTPRSLGEPYRGERNIQDIIADIVSYQEESEVMGPEWVEGKYQPEMQRGYDIGNILNR